MAFTTLSGNLSFAANFQTTKLVATGFEANKINPVVNKGIAFVLGAAIANGANEVYATLLTIGASLSTTLDLEALADIYGVTIDFARIKGVVIWLLSATDTSPDGTANAGSAASSIVVGNAAANPFSDPISEQATGTVEIFNGGFAVYVNPSTTGWVVDGTHSDLKIANQDAGVSAKVLVFLVGADA